MQHAVQIVREFIDAEDISVSKLLEGAYIAASKLLGFFGLQVEVDWKDRLCDVGES